MENMSHIAQVMSMTVIAAGLLIGLGAVSYTHLTLPTNREV